MRTKHFLNCWGRSMLVGLLLVAIGCNASGGDRQTRQQSKRERNSQRVERNGQTGEQNGAVGNQVASGPTELWLFGTAKPSLAEPFDAKGLRMIVDLRTFRTQKAIQLMQPIANNGLGLAICLRWKNPGLSEQDERLSRQNFDVPPNAQEASRALAALREVVSSEPAKRMGKRLYIQIFNEIGGGPGRFGIEHTDAMFSFADRAAATIRSANPDVRIVGPAVSGGQLAMVDQPLDNPAVREKAELLKRSIAWTAANADVADVHLNGQDVDMNWADQVLTTMRGLLNERGGQKVGLISLEWSCSGYGSRTDERGIREYTYSVWAAINKHHLEVAAYTYWPLLNVPQEMSEKTSWASVVGPDNKPNQPVWDTLVEIGKHKNK